MIVIEIAERMERLEPSPLFVPGKLKKSGEGSRRSIGFAISIAIIADWRHKIP